MIKRFQPLLNIGDFILVNGKKRKITYLAPSGVFEWSGGFARINQLETNPNTKSKILFTLKTN